MEIKEKWAIVQPTHSGAQLIPSHANWSNDSFHNLSRIFQAPLYHINEENIPLDFDVYHLCNFDIELIEKEIEFIKKVKSNGAKVIIGFSQDMRFLHGGGLLSSNGTLYTALCEAADGITSGCNADLRMYGRYQDKVIEWGEILEPLDFSVPYEERTIDFLTSGPVGEQSLSFELELLLMIKEKYPAKRVVSCVHGIHHELVAKLIDKYPQIEFPFNFDNPMAGKPLIHFLQQAKVYCNPEIRPRPARASIEAYYCRVPFISGSWTYLSRLCPDFSYTKTDLLDMLEAYEKILNSNIAEEINKMNERAQYDMLPAVYKRAKEKIGL